MDFTLEALKRYVVLSTIHKNNNFKDTSMDINDNILKAAKTIKEIDMLFGKNQPTQHPMQQQPYTNPFPPIPQQLMPQQPMQQPQYQPPMQQTLAIDQVMPYINDLYSQFAVLRNELYSGLNELERLILELTSKLTNQEKKGS